MLVRLNERCSVKTEGGKVVVDVMGTTTRLSEDGIWGLCAALGRKARVTSPSMVERLEDKDGKLTVTLLPDGGFVLRREDVEAEPQRAMLSVWEAQALDAVLRVAQQEVRTVRHEVRNGPTVVEDRPWMRGQ